MTRFLQLLAAQLRLNWYLLWRGFWSEECALTL